MNDNTQCRKWQITINNPNDRKFDNKGNLTDELYTRDRIHDLLSKLKLVYWCLCDETGSEGTPHIHIYIVSANGTRFKTLKTKFPTAHLEMCNGNSQQNRDYIRKEGKYSNSPKKETNHIDTFEEDGELPVERQGKRNDLEDLYDMIKAGHSNFTILETNPEYMMQLDKIDIVRQTMREEEFKNTFRRLEVTYVYGITETGKTRGILEKYGFTNVYRVTDYKHPFDSYRGQDVILFEEFRKSLPIECMLNYLDGYPLELPCRFNNKHACYTKVYMASNWTIHQQYAGIQLAYPETWKAFLRRIHHFVDLSGDIPQDWLL